MCYLRYKGKEFYRTVQDTGSWSTIKLKVHFAASMFLMKDRFHVLRLQIAPNKFVYKVIKFFDRLLKSIE